MSVAVVILAAGESSRLGFPKQLIRHRGSTLVRHAIESALPSVCSPAIDKAASISIRRTTLHSWMLLPAGLRLIMIRRTQSGKFDRQLSGFQ
jgi:CTP:molybdopterin cytidylyltransferase MocA